MYHKTTVFDLVLPRVLAGERIGREELAELATAGCASIVSNAAIQSAPSESKSFCLSCACPVFRDNAFDRKLRPSTNMTH